MCQVPVCANLNAPHRGERLVKWGRQCPSKYHHQQWSQEFRDLCFMKSNPRFPVALLSLFSAKILSLLVSQMWQWREPAEMFLQSCLQEERLRLPYFSLEQRKGYWLLSKKFQSQFLLWIKFCNVSMCKCEATRRFTSVIQVIMS